MTAWIPRAAAADSERAGKWQGSIPITFTSGADYNSEGTSVNINDDLGWGFGFGYNLTDHFMVGIRLHLAERQLRRERRDRHRQRPDPGLQGATSREHSTPPTSSSSGSTTFSKGRITPFLRASFGLDLDRLEHPVGSGDGDLLVGSLVWAISATPGNLRSRPLSFAYGAAAGLRAELGERFFIEGSYNVLWVDFDRAGTQSFDGIRLNVRLGVLIAAIAP